jgi:hypothetical protein
MLHQFQSSNGLLDLQNQLTPLMVRFYFFKFDLLLELTKEKTATTQLTYFKSVRYINENPVSFSNASPLNSRYPLYPIGKLAYLGVNGGLSISTSNQGGYSRLCLFINQVQAGSATFGVNSNLNSAWLNNDLSDPMPVWMIPTLSGISDTITATNQYTCANLDFAGTYQQNFYRMNPTQRTNGLMISYLTTLTEMQFETSGNQAFIESVSCKLKIETKTTNQPFDMN